MPLKAAEPFIFYTSLPLVELTGVRASTLLELAGHLHTISSASVYYHTHQTLREHQYPAPEPPNDFAYWASEALGDERLGEALSAVDIMSYPSISAIRAALIETLSEALAARPRLKNLLAPEGMEFNFLKSRSFVLPTSLQAYTLPEFADCLRIISLDSIYFHMFEARLRLERPTNDFSNWLANSLGEDALAVRIARLDPYSLTGEGIRTNILKMCEARLRSQE